MPSLELRLTKLVRAENIYFIFFYLWDGEGVRGITHRIRLLPICISICRKAFQARPADCGRWYFCGFDYWAPYWAGFHSKTDYEASGKMVPEMIEGPMSLLWQPNRLLDSGKREMWIIFENVNRIWFEWLWWNGLLLKLTDTYFLQYWNKDVTRCESRVFFLRS